MTQTTTMKKKKKEVAYEQLAIKLSQLHATVAEFSQRMETAVEINEDASKMAQMFDHMYVRVSMNPFFPVIGT